MNPPPSPPPPPPPTQIPPALITALQSSSFPIPSSSFLQPILSPPSHNQSSSSPLTPIPHPRTLPLPSLLATTKHRLLSLSLTTPNLLSPTTHSLPPSLLLPTTRESILDFDIPVQVLDIEDIGRSKSELLSAIESERKGERVSGREVIRAVDSVGEGVGVGTQVPGTRDPDASSSSSSSSNNPLTSSGPYKLLLQDRKGTKIYAFQSGRIPKLGFEPVMYVGCKIMLKKGTRVRRGVVWLEGRGCVVLGGRVEELHRLWKEGWEERLRRGLGVEGEG